MTALVVESHTPEAVGKQTLDAITIVITYAAFLLVSDRDESTNAMEVVTGGFAIYLTVRFALKRLMTGFAHWRVGRLQETHPARLQMILHQIRERVGELQPIVEAVEAQLAKRNAE